MKAALAVPVVFALAVAPAAAQKTTPVGSLLDRASAYVTAFVRDFSTVVAEERYVQDSHPMPEEGRLRAGANREPGGAAACGASVGLTVCQARSVG